MYGRMNPLRTMVLYANQPRRQVSPCPFVRSSHIDPTQSLVVELMIAVARRESIALETQIRQRHHFLAAGM